MFFVESPQIKKLIALFIPKQGFIIHELINQIRVQSVR